MKESTDIDALALECAEALMIFLATVFIGSCSKAHGQGVIAPATNAPVWQQARMHEVALQWEPSPDAAFYRIYALSIKTTNQWISRPEWLLPAADDKHAPVNHSIFVDLSVPTWTRVTAIDAAHRESTPTQPVFHPADVPPRPPGQHRFMYSRPMAESVAHRARITPMPVPPLPPEPANRLASVTIKELVNAITEDDLKSFKSSTNYEQAWNDIIAAAKRNLAARTANGTTNTFVTEYSWFLSPSIGFFNDDTSHSSWHTTTNANETTVKMILRDGSVWQAAAWNRVP